MKRILDIKALKPGQEMIKDRKDGYVDFYKFLMIHPENDEYVLLTNSCKEVDRFYKNKIYERFYTDCSDIDLIMIRRNHALKELEECDKKLAEMKE